MNLGSGWSCLVQLQHLSNIRNLDLTHNDINSDGAASLASALQYLTTLEGLYLSYNNIGPAGMTALSKGLLYLTILRRLNLSHNDIDFEGAKAVITSLKGCHHLHYAVINIINIEHELYKRHRISVHGLISPDNTSAINDLVALLQNVRKQREILDLGFKIINISPKRQV